MADSSRLPLRLSTVILPVYRWSEGGRETWSRAEELGFHTAYTYDHLSWRSFRDLTWFGALPTLTAAAGVTERLRLGTLVTSPNFRHPVPLAKELLTLDDVSSGRVTLGIGSGGTGFDATALGSDAWPPGERAERFAEFVRLLDRLLSEGGSGGISYRGEFYSAHEVRMVPGCVQRPRLPFAVAATGPRGMRLAARHGQAWVTTGDPATFTGSPGDFTTGLARQVERLEGICDEVGREASSLERTLLDFVTTPTGIVPLASVDAFVDYAGTVAELGFTELVVHWPVPDSVFAADLDVFERIATEGLAQLAR
ncbi:LLM class flavin-dependent oxidoreductase [Streptomyces radicis]|uniref:LLM class flavin-dependent oxidoreductase n=1 Tax=Streptomyces radicis TaxID=1750517 RepID=A0A3A9WD00_9ACTN|nr:LLM class flavin-dependent oxidoreductase [Streptomyces radicis]RKN07244.1 LLM class flavin-dependent oxidoreductase [Streptomyces radicis]RKN26738.1 LLM class flavin-dependent oxidoreductase [Streptomyces radicis]